MKRVLVFGMTENPGGVESVIMNYYRNMDLDRINFDFLCNTLTVAYEREILQMGGRIFKITARSKNYKQYHQDMKNFFQEHAKEYDTIWVNVCSLANIDYLKYAKKYHIKYRIIHSHNSQNMDSFFRGLLHRFNKLFIKKYATDFWTCSEIAGTWFYGKKILKSDKYRYIPNAIHLEKFAFNEKVRENVRKELKLENQFVIGNVGRLHYQKNQSFLIQVFAELKKKEKNAKLVLVGQGPDEQKLKEEVRTLQIEQDVLFLGVREDVEKLLQAFDVFVLTSRFEGLVVALLEAQASGLPIVSASQNIQKQIKIIDDFTFLSLEDDLDLWVNAILAYQNMERKSEKVKKQMQNAGYDIKKESNKILEYLIRD